MEIKEITDYGLLNKITALELSLFDEKTRTRLLLALRRFRNEQCYNC